MAAPVQPEPERVELSVLVPAYNEAATVEAALERVLMADLGVESAEVVVVDDGSTDGTREALRGRDWPAEVRVVNHERNRGKGAALRTALAEARGRWTTILDADLEYDPASIAELIAPLRAGTADAVYGIRGFQAHSSYSFWYVAGNKAVSLAANVLYNSWLADIMTCHKLIPTELFRSLALREPGFAIEAEITARLLQSGARIYEVPIVYAARTREEGKKLTGRDGLRVLRTLVRCRLDAGRRRSGR
jgi:glycosyltransferase involved in cell wall biosynthesis